MMDRSQFASLGVAALCMAALGVSATTLDGTVSTSPDDAIDLNFDSLPIGQDSAENIDREIESNRQGESGGQTAGGETDRDTDQTKGVPADRGEAGRDSSPGESGAESASQQSQGQGPGPIPGTQSWLDRLLELLTALLPYALAVLAVGVVLAFAYRYRSQLLALALVPVGLASRDEQGESSASHPWDGVDFGDDVQRAWYAMVHRAGVDQAWTKTPEECRRRAVEAGLDPDAVETLTETFREARYAEDGPNQDHERRARESIERLGLGRRSV